MIIFLPKKKFAILQYDLSTWLSHVSLKYLAT
jgi:hypothetical protein